MCDKCSDLRQIRLQHTPDFGGLKRHFIDMFAMMWFLLNVEMDECYQLLGSGMFAQSCWDTLGDIVYSDFTLYTFIAVHVQVFISNEIHFWSKWSKVATLYDNFTYALSHCFSDIRATYKYDHPLDSLQRLEYDSQGHLVR